MNSSIVALEFHRFAEFKITSLIRNSIKVQLFNIIILAESVSKAVKHLRINTYSKSSPAQGLKKNLDGDKTDLNCSEFIIKSLRDLKILHSGNHYVLNKENNFIIMSG